MAGFWPDASGPFAAPMNDVPKMVFSNSLTSADWGEIEPFAGDRTNQGVHGRERRRDPEPSQGQK
jgi:hypothetical protein